MNKLSVYVHCDFGRVSATVHDGKHVINDQGGCEHYAPEIARIELTERHGIGKAQIDAKKLAKRLGLLVAKELGKP